MWRLINLFELRNYVVNIKVITTLYLDFDCVLNHPLPRIGKVIDYCYIFNSTVKNRFNIATIRHFNLKFQIPSQLQAIA